VGPAPGPQCDRVPLGAPKRRCPSCRVDRWCCPTGSAHGPTGSHFHRRCKQRPRNNRPLRTPSLSWRRGLSRPSGRGTLVHADPHTHGFRCDDVEKEPSHRADPPPDGRANTFARRSNSYSSKPPWLRGGRVSQGGDAKHDDDRRCRGEKPRHSESPMTKNSTHNLREPDTRLT
jgi:hypothetical protein